jgi:hypothetical protein
MNRTRIHKGNGMEPACDISHLGPKQRLIRFGVAHNNSVSEIDSTTLRQMNRGLKLESLGN